MSIWAHILKDVVLRKYQHNYDVYLLIESFRKCELELEFHIVLSTIGQPLIHQPQIRNYAPI